MYVIQYKPVTNRRVSCLNQGGGVNNFGRGPLGYVIYHMPALGFVVYDTMIFEKCIL